MINKTNIYKLIPDWFKMALFKLGGKKPFCSGYTTFKFRYIKDVINNEKMMDVFKNNMTLPEKYGYGLDDRVIEYPWVLSRISSASSLNLLDTGSAINFKEILEHNNVKNKKVTIVNLNPESNCFWNKGVSYFFGDIRELPLKDDNFDIITCISTLEHIGLDNTLYIKDSKYVEEKLYDFQKAVLELKRVLKKGGSLFITVPFGKYENFGWFQQFDRNLVDMIVDSFGSSEKEISYYKYTKNGWNISDRDSCQDCKYFNVLKTKYFNKKNSVGFDSDFAAASRAVACLKFIK